MPPIFLASDKLFLDLFPKSFREYDRMHFTPLEVSKRATQFLCDHPGSKILDIGSGIGKFCIPSAIMHPDHQFFGVEIREDLLEISKQIKNNIQLTNLQLIREDIIHHSLKPYDHFYFFNSFYEQQEESEKMDHHILFNQSLFKKYHAHLFKELDKKPVGTKLASFHTQAEWIPSSFIEVEKHFDDSLSFWLKIE